MTAYTRLVAAGLIMLAMLIAGCDGYPVSPTAPSPLTETAAVPDPAGSADASGGQQANNNTDKGDDDTTSDTGDDDDGGKGDDDDGRGDDDGGKGDDDDRQGR